MCVNCGWRNNKPQAAGQQNSTSESVASLSEKDSSVLIPSDTLISSGTGADWYIPNRKIIETPKPEEISKIKNITTLTQDSHDPVFNLLPEYNGIRLLLCAIEGEWGWYTYVATIKDNATIDILYIEGMSAVPGNEFDEREATTFAILKDYTIKVRLNILKDGKKSEENKIYTVTSNGKFSQVND